MDGERVYSPTILLPREPASKPAGPLPYGVLLAVAGRDGHKLACRVPPAGASDAAPLVPGLGPDESADFLLPPNPAIYGCGLDLAVGDLRFVGHPLSLSSTCGYDGAPAMPTEELRSVNVAVVLDATGATTLETEAYASMLRDCRSAAFEVCRTLVNEERHGGRFISAQLGSSCTSAKPEPQASSALESYGHPLAAHASSEPSPRIHAVLFETLNALRRKETVSIPVGTRSCININASLPPSPYHGSHYTALAAVEGAMPPAPPLRPYLGLLVTRDVRGGVREVPADSSPVLLRLLRAASPLRSFHELHVETGIAMPMIFKLALHLHRWHRMRIVPPLTEDTVFCVHPEAQLCATSAAAADFAATFAHRLPITYAHALHLFSKPQRFGDLLRSQQLPTRKLVQVTVFLWQRQLLQQLQTCAYCVSPPPTPHAGASPQALERWRLFKQIQPMLFGEHPLEEISWQEGVDRTALVDLLQEYSANITCTVTPVES